MALICALVGPSRARRLLIHLVALRALASRICPVRIRWHESGANPV